MHFGNLNEAQFTLFWKCWENNLRVINDIIPIILRNKSYGPPMKVFMYGIIKVGMAAIQGLESLTKACVVTLTAALSPYDVKWHWVRGHTGHPENERADVLANQGIDTLQS